MDYDCETCGACCAYDESWPTLESPRDLGSDGPPKHMVRNGVMRCDGNRCVALEGEVGKQVTCGIYVRRPDTCRICEAGSTSCIIARRHFGLPVPEETITELFAN